MKNNLIKIYNVVHQPLLCLILIGISLFGSIKWAQFNKTFIVKDVKIEGINYFDDTVLIEYKKKYKRSEYFLIQSKRL